MQFEKYLGLIDFKLYYHLVGEYLMCYLLLDSCVGIKEILPLCTEPIASIREFTILSEEIAIVNHTRDGRSGIYHDRSRSTSSGDQVNYKEKMDHLELPFNPYNAEATFVQNTRVQRFLKTI